MDDEFEMWARARLPALLRAAYLLAGDQHAAEDLVQSVLESMISAWPRIDGRPDGYARQVMYRRAVGGWRQRRRLAERMPALTLPVATAGAVDDVDRRIVMREALGRLTPAQRAVLVLRFYEDLTERDSAAALGCSVGTVKSQTYKALAALRRVAPELAELVGKDVSDVR